jgi:hypothetical protein
MIIEYVFYNIYSNITSSPDRRSKFILARIQPRADQPGGTGRLPTRYPVTTIPNTHAVEAIMQVSTCLLMTAVVGMVLGLFMPMV